MEALHRLLKRQLKKSGITEINAELKLLLTAISESYSHFDNSQELLQRTMDISNAELFDSNKQLTLESKNHKLLFESLKESIRQISPNHKEIQNDDLLKIADILQEEIEKRRKAEFEIVQAREIAESSLKSRDLFFANMSHEIRTPMNGIIGMSRLLKETNLNKDQKIYQQIIQTSAEDLVIIINDILDITKISTANFTLEIIDFNLKKVLQDVSKLLSYRAQEKGLNLTINYDINLDSHYKGDPIRIKQVLINLLSNAIKFTDKGNIRLNVEFVKKIETTHLLKFEIIDTGIGIDQSKLDSVFEVFSQEDESINRTYGGTGLGLSISKQLVNAFGGILQVNSTKNIGSTFFFNIHLETAKKTIDRTSETIVDQDLNGINILLVEDNEVNIILAQMVMKKWNCNVTVAKNGQLALNILSDKKFDVILMDMQMPVMNGIEATRALRNEYKNTTPIIGFTANALKGEKENCINAGMDDYLTKPFIPEDLYYKIKQQSNNKS